MKIGYISYGFSFSAKNSSEVKSCALHFVVGQVTLFYTEKNNKCSYNYRFII